MAIPHFGHLMCIIFGDKYNKWNKKHRNKYNKMTSNVILLSSLFGSVYIMSVSGM